MMTDRTPEEIAEELSQLVRELVAAGRNDLLLRSIGVSVLEELRIEAAKSRLSRVLVTRDYRIILVDYDNREVEMTPVHKAVYLLFLNHPEGIEFKKLSDYRDERHAGESVEQLHQREVFAHQEHFPRHDGPVHRQLLHHQRTHAKALRRFLEDMVRAAEEYQDSKGTCDKRGCSKGLVVMGYWLLNW